MTTLAVQRGLTLVAATDTQLLPANPSRKYALITNDGVTDAYLAFGQPAAVNTGHRLGNGGGWYEIIQALNDWRGEVRVISSGTPKILIVEW